MGRKMAFLNSRAFQPPSRLTGSEISQMVPTPVAGLKTWDTVAHHIGALRSLSHRSSKVRNSDFARFSPPEHPLMNPDPSIATCSVEHW